jgi:hypothetical protein
LPPQNFLPRDSTNWASYQDNHWFSMLIALVLLVMMISTASLVRSFRIRSCFSADSCRLSSSSSQQENASPLSTPRSYHHDLAEYRATFPSIDDEKWSKLEGLCRSLSDWNSKVYSSAKFETRKKEVARYQWNGEQDATGLVARSLSHPPPTFRH